MNKDFVIARRVEILRGQLRPSMDFREVNDCIYSAIAAPLNCDHKNIVIKVIFVNETINYCHYCENCGETSPYIKHSKLTPEQRRNAVLRDDLPTLSYDEIKMALRGKAHAWGYATDYQSYLQSPKWQAQRKLIFTLDGALCQVCHINHAEQCHHINYEHLGDEPAGELLSVCEPCHARITEAHRYAQVLAKSYIVVRDAVNYAKAKRKEDHYEFIKRQLRELELRPDDYSRRIAELAKAMEL